VTPSEVETLRPYAPFGIDRDPSHFGLRRETVAVGDRHIETYRRDGADPANATVFLHGIDMDWSTWTPLLHAAAQLGHDTEDWVFLDLPGFGRSSPLRTTDNLASIGTLLAAVFQELEIQKPHIVGHSMGGFLLLDMISRNPELATRATVLCGAYATVVDIVNHPLAMIIKKPTASSVFVPQIILSRLNVKPIATIPRLLRPVLNLLLRPLFMTPKALAWSVVQTIFTGFCSDSFRVAASSGLRYQVRDVWQQISTPTTAAFGRFDRMVDGGDIRLFTQCVPAADVNLLPESGHFPHIEEPHRVTALIAGR
jgi:pimeloyl-ACP methyl ester carboxylesterase